MFNNIIKCTHYDLMRAKAKAGQMYFATDVRTLYKDNGNNVEQRLRFNAIILHTDYERLNTIRPTIGKFYYVEETNALWLFDTRWVLKIGGDTVYNAYYAGEYLSPIVNVETSISGPYGDTIIDNNGLLGNGSVVIRDINRTSRGIGTANLPYRRLEMKSYLDDGFLFIPNAHLPYNDLSTSLGALHLTVEKNELDYSSTLNLTGAAHYYGTWNNYGDMYLVQKNNGYIIAPNYIPVNEHELIKFYITSTKETEDGLVTNHIILRPTSDSSAMFHIVSILDEDATSVVQNDMGELIYAGGGSILENVTYECTRRVSTTPTDNISEYILTAHNGTIKLSQPKNSSMYICELPNMWSDNNEKNIVHANKWFKDKVLTYSDMVKYIESIKNNL